MGKASQYFPFSYFCQSDRDSDNLQNLSCSPDDFTVSTLAGLIASQAPSSRSAPQLSPRIELLDSRNVAIADVIIPAHGALLTIDETSKLCL